MFLFLQSRSKDADEPAWHPVGLLLWPELPVYDDVGGAVVVAQQDRVLNAGRVKAWWFRLSSRDQIPLP